MEMIVAWGSFVCACAMTTMMCLVRKRTAGYEQFFVWTVVALFLSGAWAFSTINTPLTIVVLWFAIAVCIALSMVCRTFFGYPKDPGG